jgi:hypothetical protein
VNTPGDTPEERAEYRRTHWKARKIRRGEDEDGFDGSYWRARSRDERSQEVWELTVLQWRLMRGIDPVQLRLDRTARSVQRGGR